MDQLGQRTWPPVLAGPVHCPDRPHCIQCLIDLLSAAKEIVKVSMAKLHFPHLPHLHLIIIFKSLEHQRPCLVLCLLLPSTLPTSMDDAETSQPQQDTTTHYTNTHTILPCRRGDVSGGDRDNLLSFKHSMHPASSSISSHMAEILSAWKYYSSILAHTLQLF